MLAHHHCGSAAWHLLAHCAIPSHELWEMIEEREDRAAWPKYDAALAKEEEIEIPGAD